MENVIALSGPTPERILQFAVGFQPLYALASALDLQLFSYVADGKTRIKDIESATKASRRGLRMLLNAMVGLGLMVRVGSSSEAYYRLTKDAEAFLVEDQPSYLGGYIRFLAYRISNRWWQLTECIQTGKPATVEGPDEISFWEELVDLLFPWNYPAATHLGKELKRLYPAGGVRLLDIAAGSGVWGIAAAQADPTMQVVAFDLPRVIAHAQRNAEHYGISERFKFYEGDICRDDLGDSEFDVAILGQICHFESVDKNQRLLTKVARALKPNGTIIVIDMMPNEERSGPLFTLLYDLNLLITTTEGSTYTFTEYENWLKEAGFQNIRLMTAGGQMMVLATRTG